MERVSISIQVLKVILPLLTKQHTFANGKHDKDLKDRVTIMMMSRQNTNHLTS